MFRKIAENLIYIIIFFIAVIYILSPIDFLPEGLLGIFGLIDDLLAMFIGGLAFIKSMKKSSKGGRKLEIE